MRSAYSIFLIWLLLGVIFSLGLVYGQTELAMIYATTMACLAMAWLWSKLVQNGIEYRIRANRTKVFPGTDIDLTLDLANRQPLPVWLQATAESQGQPVFFSDTNPNSLNAALLGREEVSFTWRINLPSRGVYQIGPKEVVSGDLMGLFPRKTKTDSSMEIVVFPRLVPLMSPRPLARELFGKPGAKGPVKDPVYLLGTRDYQPGRPARFIHWQASARHDRWQEKVFESSSQAKVVLALDVTGYSEPGLQAEFEKVLEVLASLTVAYDRLGIQVGLLANGRMTGRDCPALLAPAGGGQASRILEVLARLKTVPVFELHNMLRHRLLGARSSSVVLFSRIVNSQTGKAREVLRRQGNSVVFVTSHREKPGSATHPDPPFPTLELETLLSGRQLHGS